MNIRGAYPFPVNWGREQNSQCYCQRVREIVYIRADNTDIFYLQKIRKIMHEMSIVEAILESVLQEADKHHIHKVKSIKLKVGKLRQIIPETLQFCYKVATQGTIANGSEMLIVQIPIVAKCKRCKVTFEVENYFFICPDCNVADAEVISGDELILETIEMEPL